MFDIKWIRKNGHVQVNGSYEGRILKTATNQQRLLEMADLGNGDWMPSPFNSPHRCPDACRSITQKTVSRLNRNLVTIKIVTRNNGTEIRVVDRED